jgi:hypothetical protein
MENDKNKDESNVLLLNLDEFEVVIKNLERSQSLGDLLAAEQLRFHIGIFRDIQIKIKDLPVDEKFKTDPRTGGIELNPIIKQGLALSSEIVKMVDDLGLTSIAQAKLIKAGKDVKRAKSIENLKGMSVAAPSLPQKMHVLKKAQ